MLGIPEQVFDHGAVPVPVFDRGRLAASGHVEVGHDERIAVDGVRPGQLVQGQCPLVGVQGAAPPHPRVGRYLSGGHVEADPADQGVVSEAAR
jgi:hypothetical protein